MSLTAATSKDALLTASPCAAERGFWTFDDADEEDAEPILFVAKPEGTDTLVLRSPGQSFPPTDDTDPGQSPRLHPAAKYSPLGIDLGVPEDENESARLAGLAPTSPEDAAKRDAEDLRRTVDQVRSQTLLMELSLDGQLFQYLSSAWEDLVGFVNARIWRRGR